MSVEIFCNFTCYSFRYLVRVYELAFKWPSRNLSVYRNRKFYRRENYRNAFAAFINATKKPTDINKYIQMFPKVNV